MILAVFFVMACSSEVGTLEATSSSCMHCHNGSLHEDYAGPGIEDPHPFGVEGIILCTTCHGGNPNGADKEESHIPPPPEIGDREHQDHNAHAYFNRLTLTGIDKFPNYTVEGTKYTALQYLQFINPGDLRVVTQGNACGECHAGHAECVNSSLLATETGILSGALYEAGTRNRVPESRGLYLDTAADVAFRSVADDNFAFDPSNVGAVERLIEMPVTSVFGEFGELFLHDNPAYDALALSGDLEPDNSIRPNSNLDRLYREMTSFTCGDCHLGSAGANNRYGDFRSSGCTACHMQYSLDGRSGSKDGNVNKLEPANPDAIRDPEQPHVASHVIRSVARTLPDGDTLPGIDDYACAGCHQGSNRTVMQYWGIRLDQNEDVRHHQQYPANPVSYRDSNDDERLFDPEVGNRTFNGRDDDQYLVFEDYDGDGRDDTPEDVHYQAGMGCIDCHGSYDLHGGQTAGVVNPVIASRMEQAVAIRCESCHGTAESYAATKSGTTYDGQPAEVAKDSVGNRLRHVVKEADGSYYLTSRLTGARHYVPQVLDIIADNGKLHPYSRRAIYNPRGSYAMGRIDGESSTGIGPQQASGGHADFSHMDNMDCASCHSSWTNTCTGCHLGGEYDEHGQQFSNITGERIVFNQADADFVYQSPVLFNLGVNAHDKVGQVSSNSDVFFKYTDLNGVDSQVFAFSDRNGGGNNPALSAYPAMSHNAMMAHSIRGRVTPENEGVRYCVSCHLTESAIEEYGDEYDAFRAALASGDFGALDFELLQEHIGRNPSNQLNSPFFVHMAAGLGTGLFLFDEHGAAVNPLDENANRAGCNGVAPADNFDPDRVALNLDRVVEENGVSNGSSNHALLNGEPASSLRDGALNPGLSGPLGARLIELLSDPDTGLILDSWLDADRRKRGHAGGFID